MTLVDLCLVEGRLWKLPASSCSVSLAAPVCLGVPPMSGVRVELFELVRSIGPPKTKGDGDKSIGEAVMDDDAVSSSLLISRMVL